MCEWDIMDGSNPRVESVLVFCEARIGELGAIAFVNIQTKYSVMVVKDSRVMYMDRTHVHHLSSMRRGEAQLPKDMEDQRS